MRHDRALLRQIASSMYVSTRGRETRDCHLLASSFHACDMSPTEAGASKHDADRNATIAAGAASAALGCRSVDGERE